MTSKLIRVRGECTEGETCASVRYHPASDELLMQGYLVDDPELLAELNVPPGEQAVRMPASLFPELRAEIPTC